MDLIKFDYYFALIEIEERHIVTISSKVDANQPRNKTPNGGCSNWNDDNQHTNINLPKQDYPG